MNAAQMEGRIPSVTAAVRLKNIQNELGLY